MILEFIVLLIVGLYVYYKIEIENKNKKKIKEKFLNQETETVDTETLNTQIVNTLNTEFSVSGLNFRALNNCKTFSESDIDYCINKEFGAINEHTNNPDISTGPATFLNSSMDVNLPNNEYVFLILPGDQPSSCFFPQQTNEEGCGSSYQLCGSNTNSYAVKNYYLDGKICRLDKDQKDLFIDSYKKITKNNSGAKNNQNELIWSGSKDILAIGYLNDVNNTLGLQKLRSYKNKTLLMQSLIKNKSSLEKNLIPVVQIYINSSGKLSFRNYDNLNECNLNSTVSCTSKNDCNTYLDNFCVGEEVENVSCESNKICSFTN